MKLNDFLSVVSFSVVLRSELQTTHAFANNRMLIVLFSCKQQSIHSLLFCFVFDFHALGVVNKVQVFHCVFAPPGFEYNNFIWPCLGFRCLFVCVDSSAPQFKQKNTFVYSNFIWDAKKLIVLCIHIQMVQICERLVYILKAFLIQFNSNGLQKKSM